MFDKDKRHQMLNDLRTFLTGYECNNLIRFFGAYYEEGRGVVEIRNNQNSSGVHGSRFAEDNILADL